MKTDLLELPPISLYIHYPWCIKKCPYCDFNSHQGKVIKGYIKALLRDLDNEIHYLQGRSINSIFIGGGTPSLMTIDEMKELFQGLQDRLSISSDVEVTLEANPGAFEVEKFAQFRETGINRLSIGAQSFNNKYLKLLDRIHTTDESIEAIERAKSAGFNNLNIDLMYGISGQTREQSLEDIKTAISFEPSHISLYQLTLEPNTLFAKYPPKLPKDEIIWEMGSAGADLLESSGFKRYEISAYGKNFSQHNLNYWEFGDYVGIGAGAHGKITDIIKGVIFRTMKPKSPEDYMEQFNSRKNNAPIVNINNLSFEFMLNALRLKEGFTSKLFESRTGLNFQTVGKQINKAKKLGLIDIMNDRIVPTEKGFNFVNDLQEMFL
ncbi:MAG: radical SAM family heme chaperone HemW [Gammaproteobacteria bacterium]|nr:radical SAM family heme chaperone HemW [Gammaproteobacteria bacterium]